MTKKSIITKRGDAGETDVLGGRMAKDDALIALIGDVDELNANIGACAVLADPALRRVLERIQSQLFVLGAEAAAAVYEKKDAVPHLGANDLRLIEGLAQELEEDLPPLTHFILPGGSALAAELHRARAVCRRAERTLVRALAKHEDLAASLPYLNRLSDLLFLLARTANRVAGVADIAGKGSALKKSSTTGKRRVGKARSARSKRARD